MDLHEMDKFEAKGLSRTVTWQAELYIKLAAKACLNWPSLKDFSSTSTMRSSGDQ